MHVNYFENLFLDALQYESNFLYSLRHLVNIFSEIIYMKIKFKEIRADTTADVLYYSPNAWMFGFISFNKETLLVLSLFNII